MSLAAAALQIATVKALEGKITATVFDSKADPLKLRDKPQPVVVVCVVEGRLSVDGLSFFEAQHSVDLVLDTGIARKVVRQVDDGGTLVDVEFPDNDTGHDLVLHTLGYEILRALFAANTNDTWADLWKRLASRASGEGGRPSMWERGASAEVGRLAVTRRVLRLEIVNDPVPGMPLNELWTDLLAAMDADAELSAIAKLWRALITTPALPDWMQAQAQLGLTLAGIRSLGFSPLPDPDAAHVNEPVVPATEATIEGAEADTEIVVDEDGPATLSEDGGAAVTLAEVPDA